MRIEKLPPLVVSQIAAGEVIERPASLVKELIENSLDAGATVIDIAIEDGGRQLVRISDNGCGIAADELALAVTAHATSKLRSAAELAAIRTMGFRGEALASMASVSRLRITSRATTIDAQGVAQAAEAGAVIEATADQAPRLAPAGCAPGTVVEVRDLFYNTPARRSFLRPAATEFGQISDLVARLAMAHSHVGFTLMHGERKTMELPADQSRRERCVALLGRELDEALLEFEHTAGRANGHAGDDRAAPPQVWGLAGLPSIARATSKFQYLCVNGRPIRDRGLAHAIKEAYRGLIPPDRQPVAVVFVQLDPAAVDVNVHPAKTEVRFREPSTLHGLVLSALRQRLLGSDLTPRAEPAMAGGGWRMADGAKTMADGEWRMADGKAATAEGDAGDESGGRSAQAFVDYFRRMNPVQKGFVYQEVKREVEGEQSELLSSTGDASDGTALPPSAIHHPPSAIASPILQVHKSYLVTQDEQGILIIDQHALHERIMFEQLSQRVLGEGKTLESQRLLMPAVIPASAKHMALVEALTPLLTKIGIEIEPIGPEALGIHAFPSFLFDRKVDPIAFMQQLLDRVEEGEIDIDGDTALEAALHEVLDMMACKAAVKAGDPMSPQELATLLEQRDTIERGSSCPHGRPTTVRLSLRDLEKQFKRT